MSSQESIVCPNCNERSPSGYVLCPYCGYSFINIIKELERVHVGIKESFSRVKRTIYDPRLSETVFKEISANPDIKGVLLILYLISVSYVMRLTGILMRTDNLELYADYHVLYWFIAPWIVGFGFLLLALFGWFALGAISWFLAKMLGGKSGLKDTLSLFGYSLAPLIPASFVIGILISFLGQYAPTITPTTGEQYSIFDFVYLPFIAFAAYHFGNGLRYSHLMKKQEAFILSGAIAAFYILFFIVQI